MTVKVCFDQYRKTAKGYVVAIKLTTDALDRPSKTLRVKISHADVDNLPATEPLEMKIYSVAKSQFLHFLGELGKSCDAIKKC
jgi:hypothetical protein